MAARHHARNLGDSARGGPGAAVCRRRCDGLGEAPLASHPRRSAGVLLALGQENAVWPLLKHEARPHLADAADPRSASAAARPGRTLEPTAQAGRCFGPPGSGSDGGRNGRRARTAPPVRGRPCARPIRRQELMQTLLRLYRDDPDAGHSRRRRMDVAALGSSGGGETDRQRAGRPQHADGAAVVRDSSRATRWRSCPDRRNSGWDRRRRRLRAAATSRGTTSGSPAASRWPSRRPRSNSSSVSCGIPAKRRPRTRRPRGTEPDGPQTMVTWFEAAAYCNWLSAQRGPRAGPVVLRAECRRDKYAAGMQSRLGLPVLAGLPPADGSRMGIRLPRGDNHGLLPGRGR